MSLILGCSQAFKKNEAWSEEREQRGVIASDGLIKEVSPLRREQLVMGGWNAKNWIGENAGDESLQARDTWQDIRYKTRYKGKPPNDLRSIKKNSGYTCCSSSAFQVQGAQCSSKR